MNLKTLKEFFKVEGSSLRLILILIALSLLLLKIGYEGYKKRFETQKMLYQELKNTLFQKKLLLTKKRIEPAFTAETPLKPQEDLLKIFYSKDKDPLLLQLKLANEIRKMAEKKNLKIEGLDLLNYSEGKRLVEIPIIIRLNGSVKDTLSFLEELQNYLIKNQKFYKVSELTLRESRENLSLTLNISFFKSKI